MLVRPAHTEARGQAPKPLEEQTLPRYRQKIYLPVHIGDLLGSRYKVIGKQGYGGYSTVWLTRDLQTDQYMSAKVCVHDESPESPVRNEIRMLQRMRAQAERLDHPGLDFTRLANDIFTIDGPSGKHNCIISKAQGCSVRALQEQYPAGKLPVSLVKSIMWHLLFAVNWLHAECGTVHTDIMSQNVLTQVSDDSVFKAFEDYEAENPSKPIWNDGVPVYETRQLVEEISGLPLLTDFGQMRDMKPYNTEWCMPDLYRAPEVLLKLPWSAPVDVWSVGMLALDLLEGKNLFSPFDPEDGRYVLPTALGQYSGLLGPPPSHVLRQSPLYHDYFDDEGNLNADIPVSDRTLEDVSTVIPPGDERDRFLKLIRGLLTWDQETRLASNEALEHEWFLAGIENAQTHQQVA